MELYTLHTKILAPFVNETVKTLAEMAQLKATPGQGYIEELSKFKFNGYAVCVIARTSGSIEGRILMHHYTETALAIGNRVRSIMLGEHSEAKKINDEVSEALTEFANTVIGLATKSLSSANLKITFSAPMFIAQNQDMTYVMDNVVEILTIPIEVEKVGKFFFSYLLNKKLK